MTGERPTWHERAGKARRHRSFNLVSILAALLMVTGACAADDEGQSAQSQEPIKIGASISQTGPLAKSAKETRNGYELWVKDQNADGGLLGREIELIIEDDQSDPATGARAYQKLITQDNVDILFGPYTSSIQGAVAPITERAKYPVLAAGASSAELWQQGYEYLFGMSATDEATAAGFLDPLEPKGIKNVALINEATSFPQSFAAAAQARADELGMEVVFHEEFSPKISDFTGLILKMREENPDVILAGVYYDQAVLLARQIEERGLETPWVAMSIGPDTQDFVDALGPQAELFLGSTQFSPELSDEAAEFAQHYEEEYGVEPSYQAGLGYAAGQLITKVLNDVGSIDNEAIRDELSTLSMSHVIGRYEVDESGYQIGMPAYTLQIQDGQRVLVWPEDIAKGEPSPRS